MTRTARRLFPPSRPQFACRCVDCGAKLLPRYAAIFAHIQQPKRCFFCYEKANGLHPDQRELK